MLVAVVAFPFMIAPSSGLSLRAIRAKVASLNRKMAQARAKELALSRKLRQYEERMERIRAEKREIERRMRRVELRISRIEREIAQREKKLEDHRRRLRSRLVAVYKAGPVCYVALVLGAENFGDLVGRYHLANRLMERDRKICAAIMEEIREITQKKKTLEDSRVELSSLRKEVERKIAQIRGEHAKQTALLSKVRSERGLYLQALLELEETSRRIERMLARRYRRQGRRVAHLGLFPSFGSFLRPVRGRIVSRFGYRRHPILGGIRFHAGVDITAPAGTPVRAARDGVVIFAGWLGGYGKCVIIDHEDGYSTLYAHCSSICVSRGQRVSRSQVVAKVGSTGLSTGPHLHFEVRRRGRPINPLRLR